MFLKTEKDCPMSIKLKGMYLKLIIPFASVFFESSSKISASPSNILEILKIIFNPEFLANTFSNLKKKLIYIEIGNYYMQNKFGDLKTKLHELNYLYQIQVKFW